MKKQNYNYLIIFSLILLAVLSFSKKNNFIIFTISSIGTHNLNNTKFIKSDFEWNYLKTYLIHIEKNFDKFYIDDYTYSELNKIYSYVKIINYKKYYTVIIKDNNKKKEDIEKTKKLLKNFLLSKNTSESLRLYKEYSKIINRRLSDRFIYKYQKMSYIELRQYLNFLNKLHFQIKTNNLQFFLVLNEF